MTALTATQQKFIAALAERGQVPARTGFSFTTAVALEKKGLVRLQVEVRNKWFGRELPYRPGESTRTWVALPV